MKILFIARHFTYFRNYESAIGALAARGHQVHLAAERAEDLGGREMVEHFAAVHPTVSFGWIGDRQDRWATFVTKIRMTIDYLRYLDPAYDTMPKLRARANERTPRLGLWLVAAAAGRTRGGRWLLRTALCACERAVPRSARIDAFLREHDPDVVLLTPLIGLVSSPQLDYLKSAKALGYPTALCVWSWDHLSSKAIIRDVPDRVLVWNTIQREEAVTLHGVPADRVVVTGAQCFDQWFDRRPSTERAAFCRRVGLPDDRPFVLYVCSALFRGSASEALFVQRWLRAIRASGLSPLSTMPVLVRPHPARTREWAEVDLSTQRDVAVWGRNPVDADARTDYFDSLYHSEAVAGLNTSAFLEGAIVGRPVFTTLLPEHHENQEGTIHFHYLLTVGGGLLHAARTLDAHLEELNESLRRGERDSARSRHFVETFVRPRGFDVPATPVFVEAVETLRTAEPAGAAESGSVGLLRMALSPLAALASLPAAEPLVSSEHERAIAARHRAHGERVAEAWREKDAHAAAEQRAKEARAAARHRYKAERSAEWRRTKTMKKLTHRIKKRIGLAS